MIAGDKLTSRRKLTTATPRQRKWLQQATQISHNFVTRYIQSEMHSTRTGLLIIHQVNLITQCQHGITGRFTGVTMKKNSRKVPYAKSACDWSTMQPDAVAVLACICYRDNPVGNGDVDYICNLVGIDLKCSHKFYLHTSINECSNNKM